MEGQQDLTENADNPAVVPHRKLRPSELLELKFLARDTKAQLSGLLAGLISWDVIDKFEEEYEEASIRLTDTGLLCDDIIKYCSEELKKSDLPKRRKNNKTI